jgi:hypothetical protein
VLSALLIFAAIFGPVLFRHIAQVEAARVAVVEGDPRVGWGPAPESAPPASAPATPTPVLVELFTSEGCSSCPPADALLARLQHDQPVHSADILVLEEHVDYWDNLGWHDRFSSHQITARQSAYAQRLHLDDNYTPQMIVDGTDQFVGNDTTQALRSIAQAARRPKLALTLAPPTTDGAHLSATVSVAPAPTAPRDADLYAALVEPMASTQVLHGENGGHTLNHVSVVRNLQRIGTLAAATAAPLDFSLEVPKDATNLRIIVFVQRANQGAILGATSSTLPAASATITATAVTPCRTHSKQIVHAPQIPNPPNPAAI